MTVLAPPRSVGGVSYGAAIVARPVGYDRPADVVSGVVESSESAGGDAINVWFKRGVQYSVKRVTLGEGDALDVQQAHAMGGNICACPEPMNLQFHNNDRALIGGDYSNRARPWDALVLSYAGGRRVFRIDSAAAFAKAPSSVNYAPDDSIAFTDVFADDRVLNFADHFGAVIWPDQEIIIEGDGLTANELAIYDGLGVRFRDPTTGIYSALDRVQFTAAGAAVTTPYTDAVDDYLPPDADMGSASGRYYWDRSRNALRFNDKVRQLTPSGISVTGWKRTGQGGAFLSYLAPALPGYNQSMSIEGNGSGLATSGGDHRVARAVEAWGSEDFTVRIQVGKVIADSGFGKAGVCVSNGVRPGAKQIAIDWYGGTPRVYTIDEDGTVTHVATFPSSASANDWDVEIERTDAGANEWTIRWWEPGELTATDIDVVTFDLGTESPLVGVYAAENTMMRWTNGGLTPGPSLGYYHTRDSLTDSQPSKIGVRVAGIEDTFPLIYRRQYIRATPITSVINVSAGDAEMTTVFDNQPGTRLEYGLESTDDPTINTLILPLECAGDTIKVNYLPLDPPDPPGYYPPAQGRLNFSTDGGTVSENRANWFDMVTIDDPLGHWPSGSASDDASVAIVRNPCWLSIDTVEYAIYDRSGSPTWTEIDSGDRLDFAVDGYVLLKSSWMAANLVGGQRYMFRVTGTELQRTGGFDAESYRLALESFEAIDEGWINNALIVSGTGGPGYLVSSVDFELGFTGYDEISPGVVAPTGMAFGTRSEVLHNADPEVDDSSLVSCGSPSRTLDPLDWTRQRWPISSFLGGTAGKYWVGASAQGIDAGSILGGAVCSHDLTVEEAMVYEANIQPDPLIETRGFGAVLSGPGPGPNELGAFAWIDGVAVSLGENLRCLPVGSTCVSAYAEVIVPDDATVSTSRIVYVGPGRVPSIGVFGYNTYINGGLVAEYWETWNGSSWVVTTPLATYLPPSGPTTFSLGFHLMGTRRHTKAVRLPEKSDPSFGYLDMPAHDYVSVAASTPGTVTANGKRHLVNVTEIVQAMLDDRGSTNDKDGYFLWPHNGRVPDPDDIATEGVYFGLLRSMLPEYTVEDFARTASGLAAARVDTGTAEFVTLPTSITIANILARVRTPSGTISTLSVPSPIPALIVE